MFSGTFGAWGLHRSFKAVGEEALAPPCRSERDRIGPSGSKSFASNGYAFSSVGGLNTMPTTLGWVFEAGVSMVPPPRLEPEYIPLWQNGAAVVNYTTSYRAPALEELYNRGPHLGNLTFEIGNPDLFRGSGGSGVELALRHSGTRIRAELIGFHNRLSDFVFLSPTGNIEEGLIEADYQQAGARFLGAEARVDVGLARDLWLNLGFDAVDAELRQNSAPLPRIPPVRGRVGFDWRRGGLNLRPEWVMANQQHQLSFNETRTPGYAVA